jgi:hypothetical protein
MIKCDKVQENSYSPKTTYTMKKLVKLLKKSGIGLIEGKFRIKIFPHELKNMEGHIIEVGFSIDDKFLGEYDLKVKEIKKDKVTGAVLCKNGNGFVSKRVNGGFITFVLTIQDESDNIFGSFVALSEL